MMRHGPPVYAPFPVDCRLEHAFIKPPIIGSTGAVMLTLAGRKGVYNRVPAHNGVRSVDRYMAQV